ncbi:hypothetical protein CWI75_03475 [Kineobactrum sediminis]|uniref:Sigma-54 factor interaction domain-containing protein n=1 Tax=Kineobactrum sediminis TaxID=1905677 RepID=A0A2N5Y7P0_9GAMM|nr:hypothetical protein CWI75_03475 [Kineobactrum sediminis]
MLDNMEGAVDQAGFLATTDTPVAIVGARGTGKMYIARVLHAKTGASPEALEVVDCREFRNRDEANRRIREALLSGAGKTLVFKSPHVMNIESQLKLARQIATRRLADTETPTYLPAVRLIALFPDNLQRLLLQGSLHERLASVFAGYPIQVPPIRQRKRAILRWAYKILGQEQEHVTGKKHIRGFTPEAEQVMREHTWHGNISEIRSRIVHALEHKQDGEWLTPVDLKLFRGEQTIITTMALPLQDMDAYAARHESYSPNAWEELDVILGDRVNRVLQEATPLPLGTWLADEVVLAALARYSGDQGRAATFLQTSRRNLSRWLPGIRQRSSARASSSLWLEPARLIGDWVRGLGIAGVAPLAQAEMLLLGHLEARRQDTTINFRGQLLGVSKPTYVKKVRDLEATA